MVCGLLKFCDGFDCPFVPFFSTVMYEMLTGKWPYAGYAAETLIYMVGNGSRQSLDKIDCSKQLKVCVNIACQLSLEIFMFGGICTTFKSCLYTYNTLCFSLLFTDIDYGRLGSRSGSTQAVQGSSLFTKSILSQEDTGD